MAAPRKPRRRPVHYYTAPGQETACGVSCWGNGIEFKFTRKGVTCKRCLSRMNGKRKKAD